MSKLKAVLIKATDNMATVTENIEPGTEVVIYDEGRKIAITVLEKIPFGHKFAVRDIATGQAVYKYGEQIGVATKDIKMGQHAHVHNIESCRGRGDK